MSSRDVLAPVRGARSAQSSERPRLSLRFEAGRGIIVLARPLAFPAGVVAELEADLGRLPGPVDLRAGASRFRHRRASAVKVEARIDLDELARGLSRDGIEARVLATTAESISIALRDPLRTIALTLVPAWDGDDLVLAVRDVRAAIDGPRTATGDALAMLRALGTTLDRERGVLRISDPLRHVLSEAMAPHGWRVPELRAMRRSAPRLEARTLVLRAGEPGPMGA